MSLGLSNQELRAEIERRMAQLDDAQEDAENFGPYADLMRMMALTAYNRAADLIALNNRKLARQLRDAGIALPEDR